MPSKRKPAAWLALGGLAVSLAGGCRSTPPAPVQGKPGYYSGAMSHVRKGGFDTDGPGAVRPGGNGREGRPVWGKGRGG